MDENYYDETIYRLDDLQNKGLKLFQERRGFCFGLDAVLLSDFAAARIKAGSAVADLCSGNGIVALLLYARLRSPRITAVEINEKSAALCAFNMSYNHIEEQVSVVCDDVKHFALGARDHFDAIAVNPPYISVGRGEISQKSGVGEARHELSLSLDELCAASYGLLRDRGRFFMVHRAGRAAEVLAVMRAHRLEPKLIRFVQPRADESANLMLIYAVKNGGLWVEVAPPLIVYDEFGSYTKEIIKIYDRENENGGI